MISNENQKMCTIPIVWIWLKWLSDATILHIDFKKIPGENPPTPRRTPPCQKLRTGLWISGMMVFWEYHTPGGGVSALLKPTAPERYNQSYCVYVRGVCLRWKINCGKNCSLLYICRLCMVVFSKQITLLIHIIIHTNGTIKKITSRIIHWKKKKIPALYGAEKKILSRKTVSGPSLSKKPGSALAGLFRLLFFRLILLNRLQLDIISMWFSVINVYKYDLKVKPYVMWIGTNNIQIWHFQIWPSICWMSDFEQCNQVMPMFELTPNLISLLVNFNSSTLTQSWTLNLFKFLVYISCELCQIMIKYDLL